MRALAVSALSRRVVVSRLLAALAVLPFAPEIAPAASLAPPNADVLKLVSARAKATELLASLPTLLEEDLPIYLTQFASLNLKPASAALAAISSQLDGKAGDASLALAAQLGERAARVSAAGRDRSLSVAAAETKGLAAALDDALGLVGSIFELPAQKPSAGAWTTASYFGPFACEGMGLQRKSESNECVDLPGK
ncbi:hypothetical protein T492DRAFT_994923 [Pavlovales sp. CCMP2436]|nr:hypothetical protein T492DRAFT_994923 [Pavlovales sp. CCMP2436]|mmetsp:Transcript_6547/g.17008  ORF Transcript_6547/g.17008 Transcript_6547/m.17008 type:complete len:195 (-) Transcript_6547:164-748(-)